MRLDITPTGLLSTHQYLTCSLQVETPGWIQFGLVKIPTEWVLADPIRESLDAAYRRQIMARWQQEDDGVVLF